VKNSIRFAVSLFLAVVANQRSFAVATNVDGQLFPVAFSLDLENQTADVLSYLPSHAIISFFGQGSPTGGYPRYLTVRLGETVTIWLPEQTVFTGSVLMRTTVIDNNGRNWLTSGTYTQHFFTRVQGQVTSIRIRATSTGAWVGGTRTVSHFNAASWPSMSTASIPNELPVEWSDVWEFVTLGFGVVMVPLLILSVVWSVKRGLSVGESV
jgi:hypothetical protein